MDCEVTCFYELQTETELVYSPKSYTGQCCIRAKVRSQEHNLGFLHGRQELSYVQLHYHLQESALA